LGGSVKPKHPPTPPSFAFFFGAKKTQPVGLVFFFSPPSCGNLFGGPPPPPGVGLVGLGPDSNDPRFSFLGFGGLGVDKNHHTNTLFFFSSFCLVMPKVKPTPNPKTPKNKNHTHPTHTIFFLWVLPSFFLVVLCFFFFFCFFPPVGSLFFLVWGFVFFHFGFFSNPTFYQLGFLKKSFWGGFFCWGWFCFVGQPFFGVHPNLFLFFLCFWGPPMLFSHPGFFLFGGWCLSPRGGGGGGGTFFCSFLKNPLKSLGFFSFCLAGGWGEGGGLPFLTKVFGSNFLGPRFVLFVATFVEGLVWFWAGGGGKTVLWGQKRFGGVPFWDPGNWLNPRPLFFPFWLTNCAGYQGFLVFFFFCGENKTRKKTFNPLFFPCLLFFFGGVVFLTPCSPPTRGLCMRAGSCFCGELFFFFFLGGGPTVFPLFFLCGPGCGGWAEPSPPLGAPVWFFPPQKTQGKKKNKKHLGTQIHRWFLVFGVSKNPVFFFFPPPPKNPPHFLGGRFKKPLGFGPPLAPFPKKKFCGEKPRLGGLIFLFFFFLFNTPTPQKKPQTKGPPPPNRFLGFPLFFFWVVGARPPPGGKKKTGFFFFFFWLPPPFGLVGGPTKQQGFVFQIGFFGGVSFVFLFVYFLV